MLKADFMLHDINITIFHRLVFLNLFDSKALNCPQQYSKAPWS